MGQQRTKTQKNSTGKDSSVLYFFYGVNKHLLPVLAVVPKPGATVQTVETARPSARGLSQRSRATID